MIADTHATRGERRQRHRLLDLLRCLFASLLSPALAIVARVFVRAARVRTRRRLSAGTHAGREPIRTQGSARRSGPFAPTRRVRLRARVVAPRELPFSVVRVASDFSPRDYAATFAALQRPTSGQVLDLVPARLLCANVFERLAAAWTVGAGAMARLGILLSFERWVMLRDAARAALQPLVERGVRVEVFYAEQASAGYLAEWFAHGRIVHTGNTIAPPPCRCHTYTDLSRRVFAQDVLACSCGGRRSVVAFAAEPTRVRSLLVALGLRAAPATFAPARDPTQTELAWADPASNTWRGQRRPLDGPSTPRL